MKKNPVVPYLLIIAFGLGLIFFMSLSGADKKNEAAKKDDPKTEQSGGDKESASSGEADPKAITSAKCISCHGDDLKGSMGPSLHGTGLKAAEVEKILIDGKGSGMPGGLLSDDAEVKAVAEYIEGLK